MPRFALIAVLLALGLAAPCRAQFATGEAKRLHDEAMRAAEDNRLDEAQASARAGLAQCETEGERRLACISALANVAGVIAYKRGDLAAAEPLLRESVDAGLIAHGSFGETMAARFQWLGRILLARGKFDEADRRFQQERTAAEATANPNSIAQAFESLVDLRVRQARLTEALPLIRQAETMLDHAGIVDGDTVKVVRDWHERLHRDLRDAALRALAGGNLEAATPAADALIAAKAGTPDWTLGQSLRLRVTLRRGEPTAAEQAGRAAGDLADADPATRVAALQSLAEAARDERAGALAESLADRAVAAATTAPDPAHADATAARARIAEAVEDWAAAALWSSRARLAAEQLYGPKDRRVASALLVEASDARLAAHPDAASAALDQAETIGGDDGFKVDVANLRGLILYDQDRLPEAIVQFRRALALGGTTMAPGLRETILVNLASMLRRERQLDEAITLIREAITIDTKAGPSGELALANALHGLALAELARDRIDDAEQAESRAVIIRERLAPAGRDMGYSLYAQATIAELRGDYARAAPLRRRALAIDTAVFGPDHPETAVQMADLAATLAVLGQAEEARTLQRRAASIRATAFGPDDPRTRFDRADLALDDGDSGAAEPDARAALAGFEARVGANDPTLVGPLRLLARILVARDRAAEADHVIGRAIALRAGGGGHILADLLVQQGLTRLAFGDLAGAAPPLRQAADEATRAAGHDGVGRAPSLIALAALAKARGNLPEASACYDEAFALLVRAQGPDAPSLIPIMQGRADLAALRGDGAGALLLRQRALAVAERSGWRPRDTAGLRMALAAALVGQGRLDEAEAQVDRFEASLMGADARLLATASLVRSRLLAARGDLDGASEAARTALGALDGAGGDARSDRASILNDLGLLARGRAPSGTAERLFRQALSLDEAALGPRHPSLVPVLGNLAREAQARGAHDEAARLLDRARGIAGPGTVREERVL